MLELGKAGTARAGKGEIPVLGAGSVVPVLRASGWTDAAMATIGAPQWVFAKDKQGLTARWATEPADAVRRSARQTSLWQGTHRIPVDGRVVSGGGTTGGWSPRPTLPAEADLAVHHQVVLLWPEPVVSRRNATVVVAATGAAVIGRSS